MARRRRRGGVRRPQQRAQRINGPAKTAMAPSVHQPAGQTSVSPLRELHARRRSATEVHRAPRLLPAPRTASQHTPLLDSQPWASATPSRPR
jgi:hypothetical protein